jgi:predicted PurR-regulated permease PerM
MLDPRSVWRAGLVVVGLVALYSFGLFVVHDGGAVIFQVVMAWLASIAMEPAVSRLSKHMKRGLATGVVMISVILLGVGFAAAFGNLLVTQAVNLVQAIPALLASLATWVNETFGTTFDVESMLQSLHITPQTLASWGADVAGGVIGVVAQFLGGFFSLFSIGLFIFYFSADAPRLQRWVAHLLPPHRQEVFLAVWGLAVKKTGGYVAARVVLAAICGSITAIFLLIIGMQNWLALGVWTGVVSQFVPTVGTYIAIALPVVVGLTSADPVDGVLALAFALVYQQIENITIEPKISADAVDMHPAVGFGAVLLGAALFGAAGAFVAVPVSALLLSLVDIYSRQYDLLPQLGLPPPSAAGENGDGLQGRRGFGEWVRRKRPHPSASAATDSPAAPSAAPSAAAPSAAPAEPES